MSLAGARAVALAFAAGVLAGSSSFSCRAGEYALEASAGAVRERATTDNLWWQSGYQSDKDLAAGAWTLGAAGLWPLAASHWFAGARVRYDNFGKTRISGEWTTDENFAKGLRPLPVGAGAGEGHAWAVSAGPLVEYRRGALGLQAETGLAEIRSQWHERAWVLASGADECSAVCATHSARAALYAGVGVRYGYAFASAREWWTRGAGDMLDGATRNRMLEVTLGVRLPF